MARITSGTIEMSWDSVSRLAEIRFMADTHATGRDAALLVTALTRWVGRSRRPFALLGDGKGLVGVDAEYRSAWSRFFQAHRDCSTIAFFNMGPVIRLAAEMFRIGTKIQLKAFSHEAEARAWLRGKGIAA